MKKALIAVLLLAALVLMFDLVLAQPGSTQTSSDQDIELLRKDLRSQKRQIVAQNIELTDKEAEKFWPVYDQYTTETIKVNDEKFAFVKQYTERYSSMTDAEAEDLIKKWLGADAASVQLRLKYIPIFEEILPVKKVVRFMQIDRRLGLLIDVQLASQLPLLMQ